MTPELSICIPTYNRASLLARSLDIALDQSFGLPVEICVSNNNSSNDTPDLLRSLTERHAGLRYENRAQNIGIDRNILAAIRMARGQYVLPIGDDETLVPGAIASILAALRSRPDLLLLSGGAAAPNLLDAFALYWDKMPLGGFVAPRGFAAPRFADRYLGTHHAYSGAVWDFLLAGLKYTGRVLVMATAEPLVEFHRVGKSWASDAAAIHFEQIPQWFDLLPAYYTAAADIARREYRNRISTAPHLFHLRAANQISRANVHKYFRQFGFRTRFRAHAIALLPVKLAHALVRAVSRLISTPRLLRSRHL